jgi:hypothetical protein
LSQDQHELHGEFQAILGCGDSVSKKRK